MISVIYILSLKRFGYLFVFIGEISFQDFLFLNIYKVQVLFIFLRHSFKDYDVYVYIYNYNFFRMSHIYIKDKLN